MTMKVTEHKIVSERKRHPNDVRYPCRGTHEIMDAGRKLITALDPAERQLMLKGDLVLDEDETAELFDSVEEGDIIGLGIFRGKESDTPGFSSNMYEVEKIHADGDWMECKNVYSKMTEEISFQDFSIALALNLAEILYRDEKPYGVSQQQEWTIKIHAPEEEEDEDASVQNAGSTPNAVVASGESITSDDSDKNSEESQDVSDESTSGSVEAEVQSADSDTEEEVVEEYIPTLAWPQCYHAFGFDSESHTYYVVISPREKWDTDGVVCDESSALPLAEKLELTELTESTFEYNHKYTEAQLRMLFKAFGCEEKTEMIS